MEIDFKKIEKKWQDKWENEKIFQAKESSKKPKYYCLEMFPYPSGSGLHMGHAWNYTIGDILARFKIMQGFNVLHPMGYDALGLPAENAAIKEGVHPEEYTKKSIKNYIQQQKELGLSYDWSRILSTEDSSFYKWDQWIFLQLFKKNLAYQKESIVNWCPKCDTVLANEQVHEGKCWRHEEIEVQTKNLLQWFFRTTEYADELYDNIDKLDWPDRTKIMQKNWIGKSYGTEIDFEINGEKWPIFTTRPDTIFGVTFMVISAQHKDLMKLVTDGQKEKVKEFLRRYKTVSQKDFANLDKEGVFTGSYAINPINSEKVPIYAGNFVVADYGSGMVMAVPAHDQRDFEFAKKYDIEIKQVIAPSFILSGINAPNKNVETVERRTGSAIIKHPSKDKFLLIKEKENMILVGGGVEKGESPEEAISREITEETGYTKFIIKERFVDNLYCSGFRKTKNVNQLTNDYFFYVELLNEKSVRCEIDDGKHEIEWVNRKEVLDKITWEHHKFAFELFLNSNKAYTNPGVLVNSEEFDGLDSEKAKEEISKFLIKKKLAKKVTNFKLRDWGISRQRYWGTPIPIIHCEDCGAVPVPEKDLPVVLPKNVKFGKGNPLETAKDWISVKCPKCNGDAKRETDTMDTFVNSSWYFLRYCDPHSEDKIFDKKKVSYWTPIDTYIGGAEHACMHLIYFRFYTKFLRDLGLLQFGEPAKKLFHQGMLRAEGGEKMSKSKGNIILPETISDKYGIDTARFFLSNLASPDKDINWDEHGITGSLKFVNKIFRYFENKDNGKTSHEIEAELNKTIKEVTNYYGSFEYRKATIAIRGFFEKIESQPTSKETKEKFLQLLSPICPHITEELWEKLGNKDFISTSEWPKSKNVTEKMNSQDLTGKVLENIKTLLEKTLAKRVIIYAMPFELSKINLEKIKKETKIEVEIFAVNDSSKYDPEKKASKAKPGKPSVYLEF